MSNDEKKFELTERNWVVADLISQFCRFFKLPPGCYLNITYQVADANKDIVDVVVHLGGWLRGVRLNFKLRHWYSFHQPEACPMWTLKEDLVVQGLSSDYRPYMSLWDGLKNLIPSEGNSETRFEVHSNRSGTDGYSFVKKE